MSQAARAAYRQMAVETASPMTVIVMLYERLTRDIDEASAAIESRRFDVANQTLGHAQDIVLALQSSLDTSSWTEGERLKQLYSWFSEQLVEANLSKNPLVLQPVRRMVVDLTDSWRSAVLGQSDVVVVAERW
jgi:flagellar secretion chaperone FliS